MDDEADQMKALRDSLRDQGYETVGVNNGREALAALQEAKFDLLLTDLMMPEMDGITLLRAAIETDPNLVCIMMTGAGTIGTAVEAMKAGALDYILKPFRLSVILPVLSRALAVQHLRLENAALQQRICEHTAELEAANKELEAFAFSASHDLRAPLRWIGGYSKMLQEESGPQLSERGQQFLSHFCDSAHKMGELIEGLLNLSRLSRQALSKRTVNVSVLINEVLAELRKEQGDRQVEVRVGDLPDSVGDPLLLKQVFFNLLSNAFKFTRGKASALIDIGCERQKGESVYFVRDNGAGFDMNYAEKLFGVFQRLHSANQFEGNGVGLSIVQRIIQRHGGRIWAEAEVDKGATFYFIVVGQSG
ncbi:MAG: sensor histidine kinase [Limisphaerales bacterium]